MAMYSVTERGTFKRCLRQWRLTSANGDHLGPIVSPVALSTGTLIHQGSQHWLLDPSRSYENHVMEAAANMIDKAHARYRAQVGTDMSTNEDDVLYEAVSFARAMAKNYELRWGTPLPEGYTLIRPEQRAQIPVRGTEHQCDVCCEPLFTNQPFAVCTHKVIADGVAVECPACGGTGILFHYLDMRFDGLVQDPAGNIHVLEHKTYKSRPNMESLKANDQFLAYMWGATQLGIGRVVGLAYDGLWRREAPPRGKSFEDLFLRTTLHRSPTELAEFGRLLPYELNAMWDHRPERRPTDTLPYNRQWQGCFDCKMEPLCYAMSRGESTTSLLATKYTTRDDDVDEETEATEDVA